MKILPIRIAAVTALAACVACQPDADPNAFATADAPLSTVDASSAAGDDGFRRGRSIDARLVRTLARRDVRSVPNPPPQDPALVKLGQSLFFDKELSGPRSIACSTCHNPFLGTADGQTLSRAQGAVGLGAARRHGPLSLFLPRNALTLWNRGVEGWDTMFWDGRLGQDADGVFFSPAGDATPQGFTNALAAFTIIPVTPREEMRGFLGEPDRFGNPNELGPIDDNDFVGIWDGVVARVQAIEAYQAQIQEAFPGQPVSDFDIVDLSNAVGAFETHAFTALDSPFDRYLAGDRSAMSNAAKRGALLFYGRAQCASCHTGALQTDFDFHNIGAPQVGIGRPGFEPLDIGRAEQTNLPKDRFRFRTPSLRNARLNGPYFHNGAYEKLEDAIRHHLDPADALAMYDDAQVAPELRGTFQDDPELIDELIRTLDPRLRVRGRSLREREVADLLAFMDALTDPSSLNLFETIPDEVPSTLPLAD